MPGHCDPPMLQAIAGPQRSGLRHIRAGQRDIARAQAAGDPLPFVPRTGARLTV